jgi:hypothetical protein
LESGEERVQKAKEVIKLKQILKSEAKQIQTYLMEGLKPSSFKTTLTKFIFFDYLAETDLVPLSRVCTGWNRAIKASIKRRQGTQRNP